jgi:hypothetical protein
LTAPVLLPEDYDKLDGRFISYISDFGAGGDDTAYGYSKVFCFAK